jgi:formate dehydrogenase maturation protein FdhE
MGVFSDVTASRQAWNSFNLNGAPRLAQTVDEQGAEYREYCPLCCWEPLHSMVSFNGGMLGWALLEAYHLAKQTTS